MKNGIKLVIVGFGCFFGGILRYICELVTGLFIRAPFTDSIAVLIVNTIGCFVIGLFAAFTIKKIVSNKWNKFVTTGFCGGLTTFSSLAQSTVVLLTTGHLIIGLILLLANMFLGMGAVYLALYLVLGKKLVSDSL